MPENKPNPSNGTHTYFVWRRSDDYIGASANHMPLNYQGADGSKTTFEQLATFDGFSWDKAYEFIQSQRIPSGV